MPYLDKQFPIEKHKPNCQGPKVRRLLIKGYDKRGNQKPVPFGLVCLNCKVAIIQQYEPNLTKKQKDKQLSQPKPLPKIISEFTNGEIKNDFFRSAEIKLRTNKKVWMSENAKVTIKEKKFRNKVKSLTTMYQNDEKWCPRLRGKINWDTKLVQRFLDIRPEFLIIRELLYWPPLDRHSNKYANKNRGWIPNLDNFGYAKYDHDCYNLGWYNFRGWYKGWGKEPGIVDLNKLSPWEKLVIAEAEGRMAYMEAVIRKYKESKIEIHMIEDNDPLNNEQLKIDL